MTDPIETAPAAPASAPATASPPAVLGATPDWAPAVDVPELNRWEPTQQLSLDDPASFDAPAAHPSQYEIPPLVQGDYEDLDGSVAAEAAGLRNLVFAADMPAHEGNALLEVAIEASYTTPEMDDLQFEQAAKESHTSLRDVMGAAEFERCRKALEKLVGDLDAKSGGKLGDYLDEHAHVLIQPLVLYKLLVHAGRREHRSRK